VLRGFEIAILPNKIYNPFMPPTNFQVNVWQLFKMSWLMAASFWPLYAILFAFLIIALAIRIGLDKLGYEIESWVISKKFRQGEKWRTGREMIGWLRQMKPEDFEKYVADIFRRMGYAVKVTGGAYDGGVDVVAEKNGIKYYIQCKRHSAKNEVGVGAVRDFYGSLADRVANGKGYMVTTGKFTLEAERFAADKPIELVDSHRLLDYIHLANGETNTPAVALVSVMRCPRDGGDLVERDGKYGKFHGCSNFPNCKYTTK
jgi:hypothetical protein